MQRVPQNIIVKDDLKILHFNNLRHSFVNQLVVEVMLISTFSPKYLVRSPDTIFKFYLNEQDDPENVSGYNKLSWFLQITDIHISTVQDESRTDQFRNIEL